MPEQSVKEVRFPRMDCLCDSELRVTKNPPYQGVPLVNSPFSKRPPPLTPCSSWAAGAPTRHHKDANGLHTHASTRYAPTAPADLFRLFRACRADAIHKQSHAS